MQTAKLNSIIHVRLKDINDIKASADMDKLYEEIKRKDAKIKKAENDLSELGDTNEALKEEKEKLEKKLSFAQ